jgi:hypothetical protein
LEGCDGQLIRELKCNHKYHKRCIGQWLKDKTDCPMCRAPVKEIPRFKIVVSLYDNNDLQIEETVERNELPLFILDIMARTQEDADLVLRDTLTQL